MSFFDYQEHLIPIHFISVKDYGAVGNGVADDATAIQSALNALKNTGGIIYFPTGIYKISVPVLFYSKQTLLFESGAVLMQGAEIDSLLRSYCEESYTGYTGVHDCLIYGATFDGGDYTTENSLVGIGHTKNVTFERCVFKNAYGTYHDLEVNSSYNCKIINCDFEGSRKTGNHAELIQIDGALSAAVYPWAGFAKDQTVSKYIDIEGCIFHDDTVSPAIGNHSDAAHTGIRIHNCIFDGFRESRGAINFTGSVVDVDIHDNLFNYCYKGVGSSDETYYIHDNRFIDCTTAIAGSTSVAHNNMVNGTYTA